ncbi:hypothetical protein HYQ46_011728 [Verticillium longisporum]|nr:hypothetical protein HYQ46_011728 [Verticillium longisporum]
MSLQVLQTVLHSCSVKNFRQKGLGDLAHVVPAQAILSTKETSPQVCRPYVAPLDQMPGTSIISISANKVTNVIALV